MVEAKINVGEEVKALPHQTLHAKRLMEKGLEICWKEKGKVILIFLTTKGNFITINLKIYIFALLKTIYLLLSCEMQDYEMMVLYMHVDMIQQKAIFFSHQ